MELPGPVQVVVHSFLDEVDERFPGRLTSLYLHGSLGWGEFFAGSDIDFVAAWETLPSESELIQLEKAHLATYARVPLPVFDGFHCTSGDLLRTPWELGGRPVFYEGRVDPAGSLDINLVTWQELADRPVVVRGERPDVRTDLAGLLDFTRDDLDTYWRMTIRRIEQAGVAEVGAEDASVAWGVLGVARLHHLLTKGSLISKSGAGRYVIEELDPCWHAIGAEALRIRERPDSPSLYDESGLRGQHMYELLSWVVEDGTGRSA